MPDFLGLVQFTAFTKLINMSVSIISDKNTVIEFSVANLSVDLATVRSI